MDTEIRISRRKLKSLVEDPAKSAAAIDLVYVSDTQSGITRISKKDTFVYIKNGEILKDETELTRIKKLVIPPAWRNVWICEDENGHLQATGIDAKNRKQYLYHPLWNILRNHTKFYHLSDFGKALPAIREKLYKDLALPGLPVQKVLATVVSLMQHTSIRIGNSVYEKLYGSFGLTTMKDKHVTINGGTLKFAFKGKKGVLHDISIKSRKLANIVKQCRDIPGKELFQYLDEQGNRKSIDSGMVNNYIKEISGGHFTAKDFRTWAGSLHALEAFKTIGCCDTITEIKKNIVTALDIVAQQLGNTRTVCKKYYVHPIIVEHYTKGTITRYFTDNNSSINAENNNQLTEEEKMLLRILNESGTTIIAA